MSKPVIFPWTKEKSIFTKARQNRVHIELEKLGFDLNATSPGKEQIHHVFKMAQALINGEFQQSWISLVSNDYNFLQAIANDIPCAFALSTTRTAFRTDPSKMITAFVGAMKVQSNFEPNTSEEYMIMCMRSGLLVIENPDQYTAGCNKYEGRFHHVLNYRSKWKLPTLFTFHTDAEVNGKTVDGLYNRVTKNLGDANAILIKQKAEVVSVHINLVKAVLHRWD